MLLHTEQYGKFKITLPLDLEHATGAQRRDAYQGYLTPEKKFREVRHHHIALTEMLAPAVAALHEPTLCLHPFGGLGATAQVIHQVNPKIKHQFWERDPTCLGWLEKTYKRGVILVEDSFPKLMTTELAPYDIIIFDPSLGSIKSEGVVEAWQYMATFQPPLIFVSDMATSKLHLNGAAYRSVFGVETWTPEDYATGYDDFLRHLGLCITDAIRDSFEMYFVVQPVRKARFKQPIRKMV